MRQLAPLLALVLALVLPTPAAAFCGFYVAGSDEQLTNDATMVVLMRDGQRTVLSMQNTYEGPPEDFAMVVPVPTVLREGDVRTLSPAVFETVNRLASPRLVEYWEQDPCPVERDFTAVVDLTPTASRDSAGISLAGTTSARDFGVKIEAQFEVGEYEIAILSARDSLGLDRWLRHEDYAIPEGAAALLQPYVEQGMKFFVAKVDIQKVNFEGGRAQLSPLRFHYDSEAFALPVRLGMINSGGTQDLIVHILARQVRYEVANYANVAIPTNLDVVDAARERFASFYASLFDHTLAQHPAAVVTEYAWGSGSCDPCPGPTLTPDDLVTLGADVIPSYANQLANETVDSSLTWAMGNDFVLTRLHARYGKDALAEDLVFQAAPPLVGGRERWQGDRMGPEAVTRIDPNDVNNFQARYVIRHEWTGPIECENPRRGIWGGPWPRVESARARGLQVTKDLAFVERGAALEDFVGEAALTRIASKPLPGQPIAAPEPLYPEASAGGCASCRVADRGLGDAALALLSLGLLGLARSRRSRLG